MKDIRGISTIEAAIVILVCAVIAGVGIYGYQAWRASQVAEPTIRTTQTWEHYYINVNNAVTSLPVSGAIVTLTGITPYVQTTDSSGKATFDGLPAGSYTVKIENTSYYTYTTTGTLTGSATVVGEAPPTVSSKSYSIVLVGVGVVDNTLYSANRTFDNSLENRVVEFAVTFANSLTKSKLVGAVATITIGTPTLVFENIVLTTGQTLTTVTVGTKYTIALGDISDIPVYIGIKIGVSSADVSARTMPITIALDDTPTVTGDTGAAATSGLFTLTVS